MRKRSGFIGALVVGALAVGVSVYAAPRADRTARGKSDARRLVTGTPDHLQAVVDGGVAGSGCYVGIKNDYLELDGSGGLLFFEFQLGGWGGVLDTYQISVDPASLCRGGGNCLTKPVLACTSNTDCEAAFGRGSKCSGGVCDVAYQDTTNPDMAINPGISACSQINLACGSTKLPGLPGTQDDGRKWYAGDLVLDSTGARGNYTICPLSTAASFLPCPDGEFHPPKFHCARVEIPLGRCCNFTDQTCLDGATIAECDEQVGRTRFVKNARCADVDCIPTDGACCDHTSGLGGACTLEEEVDCPQDELHTFTLNTECSDVACEEIKGACCDGITGVCTVVPAGYCGGTHLVWSQGEQCSQIACEAALGACCNALADDPLSEAGECVDGAPFDGCQCTSCTWSKGATCSAVDCAAEFNAIPIVSEWGLVVLALGLLVATKVHCVRREAASGVV